MIQTYYSVSCDISNKVISRYENLGGFCDDKNCHCEKEAKALENFSIQLMQMVKEND